MAITITFSQAGDFTIEDDGIAGNNTSIIRRDSDGVILAIIPHPADSLTFRATTPGVNLTFNITDSLGSGTLLVGNLLDPAQTPDSIVVKNIRSSSAVTLVSNGSIVEGGSDLAADIVSSSLILSAQTGIGTGANAIETQTGLFEAETVTGGINIGNFGNVQIGGFSADVDGLDVVTSGDVIFTNLGTILLSDETSFDSVHGGDAAGNVTLIANGYDSDIIANVDQSSIIAPRGSVFLTAGRDISFGLAGLDFGNDVRANNDIIVNAGRDFLLSGFADFFANGVLGTTGGGIVVNAGRNVSLLDDTGNSASLATLGNGGDVIITTGPNGTFTLEPPSTNAISSGGGDVVVNADRMVIFASTGITTPGTVTLLPVTAGREIVLGSLSDGGVALELSDGELDRVFAGSLIVGGAMAGRITVGAPIAPASAANFTLQTSADIFANSSLTAPGNLVLIASDNIFQLAASTITAGVFTAFVDAGDTDPGVGGIAALNGTIVASNVINGNADADTLGGSGDANILQGFAGNDTLRGFGGNDRLDGGTGIDQMFGGLGDDVFIVENAGDLVFENVGEGTDTLFTTLTFTLPAGQAVEVLSTFDQGAAAAINLTGNEFANELYGNAGANRLDGGGGADVMAGFGGNDVYVVDNAGDVVNEGPGGGSDIVFTTVNYALTAGREIEILSTFDQAGAAAINLTGNEFANQLYGNNGANRLDGGGGIDNLNGLGGDDVYIVRNAADVVNEASGAGTGSDTVFTTVSYALAAGSAIEFLSTFDQAGFGAINLTGNAFANQLYGNNGANRLDGGGGNDMLNGLGGDDIYIVDSVGDIVNEGVGAGTDTVFSTVTYALATGSRVELLSTFDQAGFAAIDLFGNEFDNEIFGNNGANFLVGGGGNDILRGLGGADLFGFGGPGGNIDIVADMTPGVDRIGLDDSFFTGLAPGPLPAGAFRTGAAAADADDRIIYDPATGALFFDADGNGAGAAFQFATLSTGLALSAGDFVVI